MTKQYDERHGGPYDRGMADSWYSRGKMPHYFVGGTHASALVEMKDMTADEIEAYNAGFDHNEECGGHKEWS